ncbi:unnamed protein product [Rotaria sordida]|uniref:Uncharacterized protein n=1 Tax=Rotaria sordida TaxID=392033 RepID=A0A819QM12_9BILA|nr:unnamed protein product [Rotaria sordida]
MLSALPRGCIQDTAKFNYRLWTKVIAPLLIIVLTILTIIFAISWHRRKFSLSRKLAVDKGIIGFPISLPDDDHGRKGDLARVAHMRKLLLEENLQT